MCPIAIDVVEKFQIITQPIGVEYDSPMHYIDHKEPGEDLPIIEKSEYHHSEEHPSLAPESDHDTLVEESESEHVIPVKHEHGHLDDDAQYVDAEHFIPEKGEHAAADVHDLPKEHWTPEFHGLDDDDDDIFGQNGHADGILEDYLYDDPNNTSLEPKKFDMSDPRF